MDERPLGYALLRSAPATSDPPGTTLLIGFLPDDPSSGGPSSIESALVLRRDTDRDGERTLVEIAPGAVMALAGRPGILHLLQEEIERASAQGGTLNLERYAESLRALGFEGHTLEAQAETA